MRPKRKTQFLTRSVVRPALTAESNYHPLPGVKCEVLNRYGVMRGRTRHRPAAVLSSGGNMVG